MRICEGITKKIKITYDETMKTYIIFAYDYLGNWLIDLPINPYDKKIEKILLINYDITQTDIQ